MGKKKRRGSSMGRSTRASRKNRKLGKKWLTLPKGASIWKEEPETTVKLDILPYIVNDIKSHPEGENMAEDVWYRFPYKLHGSVGPNRTALVCPTTIGKPCPLCEQRQEIFDDPDADNKAAGKFRASPRSLFNVKIKAGDKKAKDKILLWDISDYCFFDQVDTELEHGEDEWNDFACLEDGYTLKVRFLEESFDKTKFALADRIDFISRKDYDEDILDETFCLDDVIIPNIKTYDEIVAIMDGEEPEDSEPAPKEEKKEKEETKKRKKKDKKKKEEKKDPTWEDIKDLDEDELIEFAEKLDIVVDEDDYDDEKELRNLLAEELDIEKPKKKKKEKKEKKEKKKDKKTKENKENKKCECPYKHTFGEDYEEHDDCADECEENHNDIYDKCCDAYADLQ